MSLPGLRYPCFWSALSQQPALRHVDAHLPLDLSKPGLPRHLTLRHNRPRSPRNRQSLHLSQKPSILTIERPRIAINVALTSAAQEFLYGSRCTTIRAAIELALEVLDDDLIDAEEDVAFEKAFARVVAFDGMAFDVGPDVVDGVEESGGGESGATAGSVDDAWWV